MLKRFTTFPESFLGVIQILAPAPPHKVPLVPGVQSGEQAQAAPAAQLGLVGETEQDHQHSVCQQCVLCTYFVKHVEQSTRTLVNFVADGSRNTMKLFSLNEFYSPIVTWCNVINQRSSISNLRSRLIIVPFQRLCQIVVNNYGKRQVAL